MLVPSDYKDLLSIFNKRRVRYLIIGAYAVIYYTEPRYTKDIDIWIDPERENIRRTYSALKQFGAPLKGIAEEDFLNNTMVYQIGVAPVRVDILTGVGSLAFGRAWKQKKVAYLDKTKVNIVGFEDLMILKEKTGRPADRNDLENLRFSLRKK